MNLLIVEDEPPIARDIKRNCEAILKDQLNSIHLSYSVEDAFNHLNSDKIDLCLLDLNLNSRDGFDLLQDFSIYPFHTIIISAHTERALEAFKYGVLDFVPKPFKKERLEIALDRFINLNKTESGALEFLVVKKTNKHIIVNVTDVLHFSAADNYVEAHTTSGKIHMLNKSMERLCQLLPGNFLRVHRSHIVNLENVASFQHEGGGKYSLVLSNKVKLPVSRNQYKYLSGKIEKS